MKRLASVLVVILTSISPVSTSLAAPTTVIVAQPKIAIQNARGPVKRIPKPKLFRSNPYRLSHFALIDDQDDIFIGDDDLATSYRRRDLTKVLNKPTPDDPEGIITDDVRWKLFLIRQLALLKYREVHA